MTQSKLEIGLLILVAGMVVYLYLPHLSSTLPNTLSVQQSTMDRSPRSTDWLVSTKEKNIYHSLSPTDQIRVRRAVQYFCAIYWDRDSCLHHMITCGKSCMSYLNSTTQAKVRSAYFNRKADFKNSQDGEQ